MNAREFNPLKYFRNKRGVTIPLVMSIIFIVAMLSYFSLSFSRNQDAKTFHIVNIEKGRLLAEAAVEASTYKVRSEMNNMSNLNPVKMIKDVVTMLGNPAASWFIKMRVPCVMITGGVGASTGIGGANVDVSLSPDTLGIPNTWSEQKLDAGAMGLTQFIRELGGDDSKSKVSMTIRVKDMKPVISNSGTVLWPGAAVDDSVVQNFVHTLGSKLLSFLGLDNIAVIEINLGDFIRGLSISIFGIPIPVGDILAGLLGKFLTVKIDLSGLLDKILSSITSQIQLGDIMPIKASVVIEKLATLYYSCRVEFVPAGTSTPVVTEIEATRDIKVVDMAAPNPLYSFYWLNKQNSTYGESAWGNTGGGKFKVMNLNIDPDYSGNFEISDILNFLKAAVSLSVIRFPGRCYIGGAGKQKIPTGLNDLLLLYPGHTPAITMFGNWGYGNCFLPSAFFVGAPGGDAIPWFPYVSVPPLGVIGIVKVVAGLSNGCGKTQLFGDFCLSPALDLRVLGNVVKTYKRVDGAGITFPIPFPPCIIGLGLYMYRTEEKGYSYSFKETEPKAETDGVIENIYMPDQYQKKASMVYKNGGDFMSDSTIRDSNGVTMIDGVIYIEGPATIRGNFYGAGQIVVNGDLTVNGDITHRPKDGSRLLPFSIICFGNLNLSANCRVLAPIYAKKGVSCNGNAHIIGNFVCEEFNPGRISRDLTIWYTPEITTCSFLSLIPLVGRYMPDRYRVVLANQFSTYKVNKIK